MPTTATRPADNPFRADRIDALAPRPRGWTWQGLEARLEALGGSGAIVAPHGHGKTTLMEGLARRLGDRAVAIRIPPQSRRPRVDVLGALPPEGARGRIVLLDGSERLGGLAWRRLRRAWRAAAGLVVTAHVPGRLPTLVELRTDPDLLHELVRELAPADYQHLSTDLSRLFHRHRGDIRACLRELYDLVAGRPTEAGTQPDTRRSESPIVVAATLSFRDRTT